MLDILDYTKELKLIHKILILIIIEVNNIIRIFSTEL